MEFTEIPFKNLPIEKTFLKFISQVSVPNSFLKCWDWIGETGPSGYGLFKARENFRNAHRYMASWVYGPLSRDEVVDHIVCNNKLCVNPLHLLVVSSQANTLRGNNACAINARKTHCSNGHELTPDNLHTSNARKGKRDCRTCQNVYKLKRYYTLKAMRQTI